VQAVRHGPAISYRLNEEHWLVRTGIRPLFDVESAFFAAVGEAVRKAAGVPVRSVLVFGSVARGEAEPGSDIDLLCLTLRAGTRLEAERNLAEASGEFRRKFGRRCSVLVLPAAEFARRYRQRERFAREVVEAGWVIAGEPLSQSLR
jgi:predicted nucleotidyltransferase